MDVILPYVAWITLLAFLMDLLLAVASRGCFPGRPRRERGQVPASGSLGDRSVLERISLDVASGSFVTMVGASGCGKTTFLRMLLGVEAPPAAGSPSTASLWREPDRDRGIVFQRYSVFPHLTVSSCSARVRAQPRPGPAVRAGAACRRRGGRGHPGRRRPGPGLHAWLIALRAACSSGSRSPRR